MRHDVSKRRLGLLAIATALSGLLAAAPATAAEKLRIYTSWPESFSTPLFNEFTKQTGIEIQFVRQSAGELLARLRAEKDNPQADVFFSGPTDTYIAAKNAGLLDPYKGAAWNKIPDRYKDRDGYYAGFSRLTMVFMTNAAFLKERKLQAPTSWQDLLNPAYERQIQTADARTSGTAMTRLLSILYANGRDEAKALQYQKALHKNVQSYTKSGAGGAIPVAMGQAAIALLHTVEAFETKKKGYDVVITVPSEGVTEGIEGMGLVKGAKNRQLATKFLDWALEPAMQNLFVANDIFVLPTNPEAKSDPQMAALMASAKLFEVDIEWAGNNRKRLVDQWINDVIR